MNLRTAALDLLFPPKCPFCQTVLDDPRAPLCPVWQPLLPWLDEKDAFRKVEHTEGCWSALEYRDAVRECVHRFKFTPVCAYGQPLGLLAAQCAQNQSGIKADCVTWVPLSRKRRRERSFDQAQLMANEVGKTLGIPVESLLVKVRENQRQSRLTEHSQRKANVLGVYEVSTNSSALGKRVLLVDDVVTSGATLSACALALKQAGAAQVWCVTLAQAGK